MIYDVSWRAGARYLLWCVWLQMLIARPRLLDLMQSNCLLLYGWKVYRICVGFGPGCGAEGKRYLWMGACKEADTGIPRYGWIPEILTVSGSGGFTIKMDEDDWYGRSTPNNEQVAVVIDSGIETLLARSGREECCKVQATAALDVLQRRITKNWQTSFASLQRILDYNVFGFIDSGEVRYKLISDTTSAGPER